MCATWSAAVCTIPDSLTLADVNAGRANFLGGKWVLNLEIFGVAWQDLLQRGPKLQPPVTSLPVAPFAAHDGAKPVHYLRPGYIASNMLKKASDDRIKEVLRIMNWLAAPFGSAEDLLLTVGVKDVDYTLDAQGNATPTERSNADANLVNWKYHVQHPQVAYATGVPTYAKLATDLREDRHSRGHSGPRVGAHVAHEGENRRAAEPVHARRADGHHRLAPAAVGLRPGRQGLAEQRRRPDPNGASASLRRRRAARVLAALRHKLFWQSKVCGLSPQGSAPWTPQMHVLGSVAPASRSRRVDAWTAADEPRRCAS